MLLLLCNILGYASERIVITASKNMEVNTVDLNAILELLVQAFAAVGIDLAALIEQAGAVIMPIIQMIIGLFAG